MHSPFVGFCFDVTLAKDEFYTAFVLHDIDQTGVLERREVRNMVRELRASSDLPDLSAIQFELFWRAADEDGSGAIEYPEFRRATHLIDVDVTDLLNFALT